jgi:hypothetical protein
MGGAGTQTAALAMGGAPGVPQGVATESWNGTSWTTITSQNTSSRKRGFGTQTSTISTPGGPPPGQVATESYGMEQVGQQQLL